MRIAIIGTGVSGLVAAHLLHRAHELTIFEAADYVGGHAHTVQVEDPHGTQPVDTGFIVYNPGAYPNFQRLLDRLGVATQPGPMSFSVRDEAADVEYQGDSLNLLFAQRRNLLRPAHYRMLLDIIRFYRASRALLKPGVEDLTLGEYVRQRGYSRAFIEQHLIPLGAALWSAEPRQLEAMPARFFARFCHNHELLNLFRRPTWRVISGGSVRYVEKLSAPFRDRIRLRSPVAAVRRFPERVELQTERHGVEAFDQVVIAAHSDQALRLLADPSPAERAVLGAIRYQPNEVILHTDTRLLPRRPQAWASWNYRIPAEPRRAATLTYHMNRLQSLSAGRDYCVTLNSRERIDPERVLRPLEYHHPVYTMASVHAQRRRAEISGVNRTHYCGAYWGFGFHEDGVVSAQAVSAALGVESL